MNTTRPRRGNCWPQAGYPNGIDVTLDVEGSFTRSPEAIGSLLTKAGIRTKVVVGKAPCCAPSGAQDKNKTGDMCMTSWGNGSLDPTDIFVPTLQTGDRGNYGGLFERRRSTACSAPPDTETDRATSAPICSPRRRPSSTPTRRGSSCGCRRTSTAFRKRLNGWQPSADTRVNLHRAYIQ